MSTSVLVDRVTTGAHGTFSLSMDGVGIVGGSRCACIADPPVACPPVPELGRPCKSHGVCRAAGKRRRVHKDADADG